MEELINALKDIDKAISKFASPSLYIKRGTINFALQRYKDAIEDCQKAIQLDNKYIHAYCLLGLIYAKEKENFKSVLEFNRAIEMDHSFIRAYIGRGFSQMKLKKYDKSLRDLDRAIKISPKEGRAYLYRGVENKVSGRFEKAISDFKKAYTLKGFLQGISSKLHKETLMKAGIKYTEAGNYEKAITYYTKLLSKDPNNPNVYFYLGDAYMNLEDFDKAKEYLQKAYQLDPDGRVGKDAKELLEILKEISDIEE